MEKNVPLDVFRFLLEKSEKIQPDLESVIRKAEYFQKENPKCMTLEALILLGHLHASPVQKPELWDFAKAQQAFSAAQDEVKQYGKNFYRDEIEEAEARNGYLLIIYNFQSSMFKQKLLETETCERYQRDYEKVLWACTEKSAASIHAFIAFALYIFGEKSWMELALHHMDKALEMHDLPTNTHWQYMKCHILDKMLMPTPHIADTKQSSQDKIHAEMITLCDDLLKVDHYKDWACAVQGKYLPSNEESSIQSAGSNAAVTTPTTVMRAKTFIKNGDYHSAKELLKNLPQKSDEVFFLEGYASKVLSDRQSEPTLNNDAQTEQTQGYPLQDALRLFQEAIALNKNNFDARMQKAITLALLSKPEESRAEFQTVQFMLKKRDLPFDTIVFHAELLKLEKCLKLSKSQVHQCIRTIIETSLEHFPATKEEKKRVKFSVDYINETIGVIVSELENIYKENKEDSGSAKTYAWVLLKLQLFKDAKHIYKILYTKLQEVYDPDVVLGLARAYYGLREHSKVQDLVHLLRRDEKMAHLADHITEEFGETLHPLPEMSAIESKDQSNYKRRQRSRSFSALTPQSMTLQGQRSHHSRTRSNPSAMGEREGSSNCLSSQRSSDNLKGITFDQPTKEGSATVIPTRVLSIVAGAIASKRKEFAREHLCLEEPEIEEIECSHRDNWKEAAYQMLYKWKERAGLEATPKCLCEMICSSKKFPEDTLHIVRDSLEGDMKDSKNPN